MDVQIRKNILLTILGVAGSAGALYLLRDRKPSIRALWGTGAFLVPWIVHATLFSPSTSFLFVSDTHGSALSNAPLVAALMKEPSSFLLHGGDVADSPETFPMWWDRPFSSVLNHHRVLAAEGNHDQDGDGAFKRRFGSLPRKVTIRDADVFLMPWHANRHSSWLVSQAAASRAKWKVLVIHQPLWSIKGADEPARSMRAALADSLPYIDLVLAGHEHVRGQHVETLPNGHRITQVVEVSGPKAYDCGSGAHLSCRSNERGFTRIRLHGDQIEVERVTLLQ